MWIDHPENSFNNPPKSPFVNFSSLRTTRNSFFIFLTFTLCSQESFSPLSAVVKMVKNLEKVILSPWLTCHLLSNNSLDLLKFYDYYLHKLFVICKSGHHNFFHSTCPFAMRVCHYPSIGEGYFPSPWTGLVTSLTNRMVEVMLWDFWARP